MKLSCFALNWMLNNMLVTSVLSDPRTLEHWRDHLAAPRYAFDAEDEALVERLVPRGHSSSPGHTNRKHPVTGRVPKVS